MRLFRASSMSAVVLLPVLPGTLVASPAEDGQLPAPVERCVVSDSRLDELSGLASDGRNWYATNDGGTALEVYVLDPADCSVRDVRTGSNDPYDVEDLALASDGAVWLADTGDNARQRETIALHVLRPGGDAELYRLVYPDGAHDAEAMLLDRSGVPHIITKEPFGVAGVYRPAGALEQGKTVALERVTTLMLSSTDSLGGPVSGRVGSRLVTGASVSWDGTALAVRTYTEAYLYHAPDGDVVSALQREPVHVPLPNEPQGEAITWEPDGTLLSASEGVSPVRAVVGAATAVREAAPAPVDQEPLPSGQEEGKPAESGPGLHAPESASTGQMLLLAGALAVLVVFIGGRIRR